MAKRSSLFSRRCDAPFAAVMSDKLATEGNFDEVVDQPTKPAVKQKYDGFIF